MSSSSAGKHASGAISSHFGPQATVIDTSEMYTATLRCAVV